MFFKVEIDYTADSAENAENLRYSINSIEAKSIILSDTNYNDFYTTIRDSSVILFKIYLKKTKVFSFFIKILLAKINQ